MGLVSRRRFLRSHLAGTALALAGSTAGPLSIAARAREPALADTFHLRDFGVTGKDERDVSEAFQDAIDTAGRQGGGNGQCPAGLIWAKGLVVPNNITIQGAGVGATTIKLPDGANQDVIQQSGYAENKTFANLYFVLRDLAIDGNKTKNKTGNLVVLRGYRGLLERVRFARAAGHGVLYTEPSADGTLNLNGLAENAIRGCYFDDCDGAGIYARNGTGNRIADMFIVDSVFNGNGKADFYQIDLERAAGFHIKGNQMYRGYLGDIRALRAGALIIAFNHLDGTDNRAVGGIVKQVQVQLGGWGNIVIAGNLFHSHRQLDAEVKSWRQLDVYASKQSGVTIAGNSFVSEFQAGADSIFLQGAGASAVSLSGNAYGEKSRPP